MSCLNILTVGHNLICVGRVFRSFGPRLNIMTNERNVYVSLARTCAVKSWLS